MNEFEFPAVVDLASAPAVAEALVRHIRTMPEPVATTRTLRQGSVPLVQMLIAARRLADAEGKSFSVRIEKDGSLDRLVAALGIDPADCGAVVHDGPLTQPLTDRSGIASPLTLPPSGVDG